MEPMHGTVGVAPANLEVRSALVPDAFGGNMDTPQMRAGVTCYLGVNVDGALVSLGDGHARQGEGETCGSLRQHLPCGGGAPRLTAAHLPRGVGEISAEDMPNAVKNHAHSNVFLRERANYRDNLPAVRTDPARRATAVTRVTPATTCDHLRPPAFLSGNTRSLWVAAVIV
jgi:hypothetical protein